MPHFKPVDYNQIKLLPICYSEQLIEGTFEHALNYLVEYELDMSIFNHRYQNGKTGASAYDPKILLKIILYAYSLGLRGTPPASAVESPSCAKSISYSWLCLLILNPTIPPLLASLASYPKK